HPPCTWCKPPSWKPILMIENDLEPFISAWNAEADAILEYERLRKEVEEEIEATRTRTGATLRELLEKAAAYLAGSRLTYEPSGGRGLWCVVISSSTRSLPDYTLPPLTGADQVELGAQLAIAGARLLPSSSETTLPSFLADATADDSTTAGLGGVVRSLLGDNARIISFGLALWGSCLDLYRQQVSGLYQLSEGLPWGLDTMVEDTIDELLDTAQVNVGDMRRPLPILVSVTEVGKADAGGVEAAMVQTLQGGRSLLEQSGGFSTFGIKEQIREAAQQLGDGLSIPSEVLSSPTIAGIPIWVPFLEELTSVLESPWLDPVGAGIDLLYQLPDLTW
ncbi:MAG: hypothetical protein FWD41_03660, partial [Actinomycetia bacterium]|nr:hypothetical protein [Actinomycetes bacterium]